MTDAYPDRCEHCGAMSRSLCLCDELASAAADYATFGECPVLDVAVLGGGERRAFASAGMVSDEDDV